MSTHATLYIASDEGERPVRVRIVNKAGAVRMVQLLEPLHLGEYVLADMGKVSELPEVKP